MLSFIVTFFTVNSVSEVFLYGSPHIAGIASMLINVRVGLGWAVGEEERSVHSFHDSVLADHPPSHRDSVDVWGSFLNLTLLRPQFVELKYYIVYYTYHIEWGLMTDHCLFRVGLAIYKRGQKAIFPPMISVDLANGCCKWFARAEDVRVSDRFLRHSQLFRLATVCSPRYLDLEEAPCVDSRRYHLLMSARTERWAPDHWVYGPGDVCSRRLGHKVFALHPTKLVQGG